MYYLQYQGNNFIESIPKDELVIKSCFFSKPYSKRNGKDVRSLKPKVVEYKGCKINKNPFIFYYVFEEDRAILAIDWKSLSMTDSQAFITVELTAKYHFSRTINLHILWVEKYLNFIPAQNLTGRGRIKIGTLKIAQVCDENEMNKLEKRQHKIEVGEEFKTESGYPVVVSVDDSVNRFLASSNIITLSFCESKDIDVFMDFGGNGIKVPLIYKLKTKFNGEPVTFGSKPVTINPYVPHLKVFLKWSETELSQRHGSDIPSVSLQAEAKEIGLFYVGSDAISGEKPLDYSLTTDSTILTLKKDNCDNNEPIKGSIQPLEKNHVLSLIYNGNALKQIPETSIVIRILNNDVEIHKITLK